MLFNSIEFAIFLPIVFGLYWFACGRSIKAQNILLLVASYVFYGWWDWRFLSLIALSSALDYGLGIALFNSSSLTRKKLLLLTSVLVNVGMLAELEGAEEGLPFRIQVVVLLNRGAVNRYAGREEAGARVSAA